MKLLEPINSEHSHLLNDDSVRPELSYAFRTTNGRECYVLSEDSPLAVICVAYTHQVPTDVSGKWVKKEDLYPFASAVADFVLSEVENKLNDPTL